MPAPKKISHHRMGGEFTFEQMEAEVASRRAAAAKTQPKILADAKAPGVGLSAEDISKPTLKPADGK